MPAGSATSIALRPRTTARDRRPDNAAVLRWADRVAAAVLPLTLVAVALALVAPSRALAERSDLLLAALVAVTALSIDPRRVAARARRPGAVLALSIGPHGGARARRAGARDALPAGRRRRPARPRPRPDRGRLGRPRRTRRRRRRARARRRHRVARRERDRRAGCCSGRWAPGRAWTPASSSRASRSSSSCRSSPGWRHAAPRPAWPAASRCSRPPRPSSSPRSSSRR